MVVGAHNAASVMVELRDEIIAGRLRPGSRLPTHLKLVERFGVSNVTVQNALNRLASDGFIRIRARVGSFVVDQPPHLRNVALVFPFDPAAPSHRWNWSKYYQALTMAAAEVQGRTGRHFALYHGVDYHSDSEDRERLIRQIERRQLSGVIFAGTPSMYRHTPLLEAPDLPRVELSSASNAAWPVINVWSRSWLSQALDWLREQGRRRVAVLFHRLGRNEFYEGAQLAQLVAERGMRSPAYWHLAADWRDPAAADHLVQLLFSAPAGERPDGLAVVDDNLVEGAVAGLIHAGVQVPDDCAVVARVNVPMPAPPALPFGCCGYDLRTVLRCALELIDRQMDGLETPNAVPVEPVWLHELDDVVDPASQMWQAPLPIVVSHRRAAVPSHQEQERKAGVLPS